ncbi:hypothetical protein CRG98_011278, partial [Punica granatum]
MGAKSSRERSFRQTSSSRSSSEYQHPPPSYGQSYPSQPSYAPQQQYPTQQYSSGDNRKRLERRYSRIADDYNSLEEVTEALARAGLESSNLIVGIDFTKSNEWTASTHDQDVFAFYPDDRFCNGFEEVLQRYREIVPQLRLA